VEKIGTVLKEYDYLICWKDNCLFILFYFIRFSDIIFVVFFLLSSLVVSAVEDPVADRNPHLIRENR
jgi:hypothetical protein